MTFCCQQSVHTIFDTHKHYLVNMRSSTITKCDQFQFFFERENTFITFCCQPHRDDFDFHIVNFPYLSSNIPSGPSYGVYISQLIRYARCCSHYDDFRYRHKCLVDRLLSQGYIALRLDKSFKKFYGRYQDLIEKYQRSVNVMVNYSFPG